MPDTDWKSRAEKAEAALGGAFAISGCIPELNMGNYDHEDVDKLNAGMIELHLFLEAALTEPNQPQDEGEAR